MVQWGYGTARALMAPDVVLAPDKFKGSLTASQAAHAMAMGVRRANPALVTVECPVADGGEGTLEAAVAAGFEMVSVTAGGPTGELGRCAYARRGSTALIEMAGICGLHRLPSAIPAPMAATSYGLGAVVAEALDHGCRDFVLTLGGSASTDGGAGMLVALGAAVLDGDGIAIAPGGQGLAAAAEIDLTQLDPRIAESTFTVAADVANPLCGPRGAAPVYGPQKGASPDQVRALDRALLHWATLVTRSIAADYCQTPGAGAAGGVGFAALSVLKAHLRSGIDLILDLVDLDQTLPGAKMVLTGEGSLDRQSLQGKAPVGVCRRARAHDIPTVAIVGVSTLTPADARAGGFTDICSLTELEPNQELCLRNAGQLLTLRTEQLIRESRWLSA